MKKGPRRIKCCEPFKLGAVEKTRTSTGLTPTATSTLRVYQFRHDRIKPNPATIRGKKPPLPVGGIPNSLEAIKLPYGHGLAFCDLTPVFMTQKVKQEQFNGFRQYPANQQARQTR